MQHSSGKGAQAAASASDNIFATSGEGSPWTGVQRSRACLKSDRFAGRRLRGEDGARGKNEAEKTDKADKADKAGRTDKAGAFDTASTLASTEDA